jgi:hypothetical protein
LTKTASFLSEINTKQKVNNYLKDENVEPSEGSIAKIDIPLSTMLVRDLRIDIILGIYAILKNNQH